MGHTGSPDATLGADYAAPPALTNPGANTVNSNPVQPQYGSPHQQPLVVESGMSVVERCTSWSSISSSTGNIALPGSPGADSIEVVQHSGGSLLQWVRPNKHSPSAYSKKRVSVSKSAKSFTIGCTPASRAASEGWTSPTVASTPPSRSYSAASSPELIHALKSSRSGSSNRPFISIRTSVDDARQTSMQPASDIVQVQVGIQHRRPIASNVDVSNQSGMLSSGVQNEEELLQGSSGSLKASDHEVDGRSESLLLWRLPARPAGNLKKAYSHEQGQARPEGPASSPETLTEAKFEEAHGDESPSMLQKVEGFKEKMLRPDDTHIHRGHESGPWSIPAVRETADQSQSRAESRQGECNACG